MKRNTQQEQRQKPLSEEEYVQRSKADDVATVNSYIALGKGIRLNHQSAVVLPSDPWFDADGRPSAIPKVSFKLMSAEGTRAIDTNQVLNRYARGIARALVADWVMLGEGERGSQALSRDKSSN